MKVRDEINRLNATWGGHLHVDVERCTTDLAHDAAHIEDVLAALGRKARHLRRIGCYEAWEGVECLASAIIHFAAFGDYDAPKRLNA